MLTGTASARIARQYLTLGRYDYRDGAIAPNGFRDPPRGSARGVWAVMIFVVTDLDQLLV